MTQAKVASDLALDVALDVALDEKLRQFGLDAKLKEVKTTKLRDSHSCTCSTFAWEPEVPKTQFVYPYYQRNSSDGPLYERIAMQYCGYLTQNRLFADFEIFEFPLVLPASAKKRLRGSELGALEETYESGCCSTVLNPEDAHAGIWKQRNQVVQTYLKSVRRAVDIVRLTAAFPAQGHLDLSLNLKMSMGQHEESLEYNDQKPWIWLNERIFPLVPSLFNQLLCAHNSSVQWLRCQVFEANSADLGKV